MKKEIGNYNIVYGYGMTTDGKEVALVMSEDGETFYTEGTVHNFPIGTVIYEEELYKIEEIAVYQIG